MYTRLGSCVSESTAKRSLITLANVGLAELQAETAKAYSEGQASNCTVFDNQQQYQPVFEGGHGRAPILKQGTGAMAVFLHNVKPGAFARQPYIRKVISQERQTLTVQSF